MPPMDRLRSLTTRVRSPSACKFIDRFTYHKLPQRGESEGTDRVATFLRAKASQKSCLPPLPRLPSRGSLLLLLWFRPLAQDGGRRLLLAVERTLDRCRSGHEELCMRHSSAGSWLTFTQKAREYIALHSTDPPRRVYHMMSTCLHPCSSAGD